MNRQNSGAGVRRQQKWGPAHGGGIQRNGPDRLFLASTVGRTGIRAPQQT